MKTIAKVDSINNGKFYIKSFDDEYEAKDSSELSMGIIISGDPLNTQNSSLKLHFLDSDTFVILKGSGSITLDDELLEALELSLSDNPNLEIEEEVAKEETTNDEKAVEEIEKLEETASGDDTGDGTGDVVNDLTVNSMNYNSEDSVSSDYALSDLANLGAQNNDFSRTNTLTPQSLEPQPSLSLVKFSILEESLSLTSKVAQVNISNGDDIYTYTLVDNDYLRIDGNSGEIYLTQSGIDAINSDQGEDIDSLSFKVIASSSSNTIQEDYSLVVSRIDDNNPVINVNVTSSLTEESVNTNDVIVNVSSSDLDDDSNIVYSIEGANKNYFTIDSNTGEVKLTNTGVLAINSDDGIDLTNIPLKIVASDGTNSVSEDINISVSRIDENDPIVNITKVTQVEEDVNIGDVVATINTSDLDDTSIISYTLDGVNKDYFTVDQNTGEIKLTAAGVNAIDSDIGVDITSIPLDVIVSDGTNSVSNAISIDVTRVNDNEVVIDSLSKNNVKEDDISINTVVAKVNASDLDDGTLSYTISGTNASYVSVDSTGEVKLTQAGVDAINSETFNNESNNFTFSIKVSDGKVSHDKSVDFDIDITRIDDNAPVVTVETQNTLTENSIPLNSVVATFSSQDVDDQSATAEYSIKDGSYKSYFDIDINSGEITINQIGIDAINSDIGVDITSIPITIIASDTTNESEKDIVINVTRVNDNTPIISFSNEEVKEDNITTTDIVSRITSVDHDDDSVVEYRIKPGTNSSYFIIDEKTGEIKLSQDAIDAINEEGTGADISSLDFTVIASDGTNESEQDISLQITRINDNDPVLIMSTLSKVALSDYQVGNTIMQLDSSDLDDNDTVDYTIKSGDDNGHFQIDNTGKVVLSADGVTFLNSGNISNSNIATLQIEAKDSAGNVSSKYLDVETIQTYNAIDKNSDGYLDGGSSHDNILISDSINKYDGLSGTDTLVLSNDLNIDMSGLAKNIEKIDLNVNGSHEIQNLTLSDVIDLISYDSSDATSNDELIIYGGLDDKISLKDDTGTWQKGNDINHEGLAFTEYTNSGDPSVVLKVSSEIETDIV
jgi:hypothetical protein